MPYWIIVSLSERECLFRLLSLHEVFFGMAPLSFAGDQRANFQPVKSLIFNVGKEDPSVFHLLLAATANDIAYIRGRQESEDVIKHRGIALGLIKKRVLDWQSTTDGTLVAVALLAGTEVSAKCW